MTQRGSVFPSPTRPRLRAPECMLVREDLGVEVARHSRWRCRFRAAFLPPSYPSPARGEGIKMLICVHESRCRPKKRRT